MATVLSPKEIRDKNRPPSKIVKVNKIETTSKDMDASIALQKEMSGEMGKLASNTSKALTNSAKETKEHIKKLTELLAKNMEKGSKPTGMNIIRDKQGLITNVEITY